MRAVETQLQEIVDRLTAEHGVPGSVVGVFDGTTEAIAASGVANRNTGAPMTPETLFLIGSVTKVWLTTLLMALVDSGKVDLDEPVRTYLPEFRLGDKRAAETVTLRHLVSHSSGIDAADYIPDDLGQGDDVLARYVARLASVGQIHPPGRYASYCNPGFVTVGRVIEMMTESTFPTAFRERLFEPLGLSRSFLSAEETILHSAAIGHFPDPAGGPAVPTRRYMLPVAMGPAGSTLATCAADALTFARLHLDGGVARDGTRFLSDNSVAAMAAFQVDLPVPELGSFGLSWARQVHDGNVIISHGGGSFGGQSNLVLVPDAGVAMVAFANSAGAGSFLEALGREVVGSLLGIPQPDPYIDGGPPSDPEFFAGTYRRRDGELSLVADGDEFVVTSTPTGEVNSQYTNSRSASLRLKALGSKTLGVAQTPIAYAVGDSEGHADFLFLGLRLSRWVGS